MSIKILKELDKKIPEFSQKRFYPKGEIEVRDEWGVKHKKTVFCPRGEYLEYLKELRKRKILEEMVVLKERMERDEEQWGECDPLDLHNLIGYLKKLESGNY